MNVNFTTNIVKVTFNPNNEEAYMRAETKYAFKVPPSLVGQLAKGDLVVVHCKNGFQLARVAEINVYHDIKATEYVVSKVDTVEYETMKAQEEEKKRLLQALDAKYASFQKAKIYDMMAADDKDVADMLARLKELGGC